MVLREELAKNGPARKNFGPERLGPVHLNIRAQTAQPSPICQA